MTRIIQLSLAIAMLCLGTALADSSQPWNNPTGSTLPTGCQHLTYYSAANNTTIGYIVYLPPDYTTNTSARYPVVYSFHGMGGNEWGNVPYASVLQTHIVSKTINPMIMVFVSGRGNSFYADSKDGSVKCETSVIKELIPHIDSTLRTLPDRGHRAVNGISMGGFGSLMMAFKHYELFGHAASDIAALVNWDTLSAQQFDQSIPTKIFGGDSAYFNRNYYPFTFVKQNADSLKAMGMKVHMADNPNDVTMGPLYSYNVTMRNLLKSKGIPVEFDSAAGSGHVADFNGASGLAILKFHSDNFAAADSAAVSVLSNSFGIPGKKNRSVSFHRISAMETFVIPAAWQGITNTVGIYSLQGRELGRLGIKAVAILDGVDLKNRFGSEMFLVKPISITE